METLFLIRIASFFIAYFISHSFTKYGILKHVHYTLSHPGRRKRNEDSVYPSIDNGLGARSFVICDGVGGQNGGDVASQIVSKEVGHYLSQIDDVSEGDILTGIKRAQEKLAEYSSDFPAVQGLSTTLVGFHPSSPESGYAYWVGDSRLYHLREDEILFRTKDHSLAELMKDRGEDAGSTGSNIILQAVSDSHKRIAPEIVELQGFESGDIILLLSDGILEGCEESKMVDYVRSLPMKKAIAEIRKCCEKNSNDNFSLIAVQL